MTFPEINLESAWVSAMDFTARSAYDLRLVDPKFFKEDDEYVFFYSKSQKPPIPIIAQREFCIEGHKIRNGAGERKHIFVSLNRVHPDKPIETGFFASTVRALLHYHGILFEAIDPSNPSKGTKITECRAIDMNGSIPNAVIPKMIQTTFEQWKIVFSKAKIISE